MPAVLTVDPRSGVPIYLQIIEQVKRSVALGVLQAGEQLPTVKQLALDLTVNPNTVARAYRELERDSVIETSPGRGSFVRGNGVATSARAAASDVARDVLNAALREVKSVGLTRGDVRELVDAALDRWFPEEQ
ncbi:MAG: GntR family transcriptional regulator [Candidatus Eremiobacteraeota bacterium]|nr:GntR family transcriptional regulator [Candidatus Eremiobacteraeota bacterium]MBV8284758.1 GntR family transcriptional regulator [Candidatus Eremiobacteraeota bacterium]MBV8332204.1 GntR family transcriptional regulator [Candidatus Eremiobacteraeota bacterium]MBV8434565.1 GntR family transcriptional regulator [Candidatus Eremiobacteraeota bacterium]MBV8583521.1 GntR family transcriptional regulator [Candidatus Eremiobacteraeota bacterium]